MGGVELSGLIRRTCADPAGLDERARLASSPALCTAELAARARTASAWPAVEDFLGRVIHDKLPTLVYGDYDNDGSISAYLMFAWLRDQGVPGNIFLPSRFKHGYGLDLATVRKAYGQGYRALLALDCGTADLEALAEAEASGLACAVLDHHQPKAELPACPLLNPHLDPVLSPLCTGGLCYSVLAAMGASLRGDELQLSGLATIADLVPLEAPGWSLAHHALESLTNTPNLGLAELLKVSRLHGLSRITGRQVAFDLAPRLNAPGRLLSAKLVPDLLLSRDSQSARAQAMQIDELNSQRRDLGKRIGEEAAAQALAFPGSAALALYAQSWHPGVLGIVAAKIAGQFGRPAAILAPAPPGEPAGGDLLSGSVRSAGGVDVVAALAASSAALVSFGGHAAAAGLKLRQDQLGAFRELWSAAVAEQRAAPLAMEPPPAEAPAAGIEELTAAFEQDVWTLAPYGPGHPAPSFRLRGCRVLRASAMGADRTHVDLQLTDGVRQLRVAGFGQSHLLNQLTPGLAVEPLVEAEPDNWNNRVGIALRLLRL